VTEPEVALAFTADPWVEELHRHLSDHGGARVRSVVVEPGILREESYDVLVVGHRWAPLTRALVGDVHARGHAVLGVYDREEPASRKHLAALGVDAIVESDAGVDGFVRAIITTAGITTAGNRAQHPTQSAPLPDRRGGRLVVVGGPPGVGRTEVAIGLAVACTRNHSVALVDADDVAPAVAQRLHLPIEPNLRTAIDAVEHGRSELHACVIPDPRWSMSIVAGVPNPGAWAQVRPGEVVRVIDRLADAADVVVADGAGPLEEIGAPGSRGRFATGRALVTEADVLVAVCDASPHGITRLLAWVVYARGLAVETPMVVVVNRAPAARFRRGELYEEITASLGVREVVFAPYDTRVRDAAWKGAPVGSSAFTRSVGRVADLAATGPRRVPDASVLDAAS
jgi:MinD-like ATPase involved in chromosome partitioning or flagellar assembly